MSTCRRGILLSIALASVQAGAADFYVATSGNDTGPGTRDRPFATVERARAAVREAVSRPGASEPVTVYLRAGRHRLSQTLELTAQESGAANAPVVWRSYPGERAVLTGAVPLKGFEPLREPSAMERIDKRYHSRIVQADLRAQGISDYGTRQQSGFGREAVPAVMELFFQDRAMTVARWPNDGWEKIIDVPQPWESGAVPEDEGYYRLQSYGIPLGRHYGYFGYYGERPKRWKAPEEAWLHGFWALDYRDSYIQVERIDTARGHIYPRKPHPARWGYTKGQRFYYLNILEELDAPGEYFVDAKRGLLYFWPPSDPGPSDAYVSMLTATLIRLRDASYITLADLTIEGGRFHAVEIERGRNNTIAGCAIRNVGNYAAIISGTGSGIVSSDIYGTGEGGVRLEGGDRKTLEPAKNYARNCHFHRYARINLANHPAIRISGVGNIAANNLIDHVPHGAVNVNGNDHIVEFNEFHNIALATGDVGVIYVGGGLTGRGNVIRHNFFHHIRNTRHGYGVVTTYLDNNSSGQTVYGNVYVDVPRATYIGGGRDNRIENNVMINCRPAFHLDPRGLNWRHWEIGSGQRGDVWKSLKEVRHTEPPYNKYPGISATLENSPQAPWNNLVAKNIVIGGEWAEFVDQWGDMELQSVYADTDQEPKFITRRDNLVHVDPGFVDLANLDLRPKPGSAAARIGFEPIPFGRIGLFRDEYRKELPAREPWLF